MAGIKLFLGIFSLENKRYNNMSKYKILVKIRKLMDIKKNKE